MENVGQTAGLQFAPVQHKLTAYDTPPKPEDSPEARARQEAKDEESHPFIHYLAQFVPGLRPHAPLPVVSATDVDADVDALAELGRPGAPQGADRDRGLSNALDPSSAQLALAQAFAPVTMPPMQPLQSAPLPDTDDSRALTPVAPAAVPPLVLAEVQRMQAGGVPVTQLRVQLDPPHLGKLDLAFTYAQQKVSVNVVAATQAAKEHLDLQLSAIRNILHSHNLQSGELKVVLGGKAGPQGGSTDRDGGSGAGTAPQQPVRRRRRTGLDEDLAAETV